MPGGAHDKLHDFTKAKLIPIMRDIDRGFTVLSNCTLMLPVTVSPDL